VTTANSTWRGITSAGVTASYDAELATVSDDTPALAELEIAIGMGRAFATSSIEVEMDQPQFASELAKLFADARDRAEAAAMVSGAGTNGRLGFVTSIDGGASEIDPSVAETFTPGTDVYTVQNAMSARFNAKAVWVTELSTLNAISAATDTTSGAFQFPEIRQMPNPTLLRKPVFEMSDMDPTSGIDAGASADHFILGYMDPSEYVIAERAGMTIDYVQTMVDVTNNRPTGQRGWFGYWRNGAELSSINACKVLSIPTTA
jgi:HK97 family phage major capsid protein